MSGLTDAYTMDVGLKYIFPYVTQMSVYSKGFLGGEDDGVEGDVYKRLCDSSHLKKKNETKKKKR